MNVEASKAIRRAAEIYEERKERAFRRGELDRGALQQLWMQLQGEIGSLVSHLNRTSGYADLKMNSGDDKLEVRTERATLRLTRIDDAIGVTFHGSEEPEKTFSLYFTKPNARTHTPEWRASEKDEGLTSEELADSLVLELLNGDDAAEHAGEN